MKRLAFLFALLVTGAVLLRLAERSPRDHTNLWCRWARERPGLDISH